VTKRQFDIGIPKGMQVKIDETQQEKKELERGEVKRVIMRAGESRAHKWKLQRAHDGPVRCQHSKKGKEEEKAKRTTSIYVSKGA